MPTTDLRDRDAELGRRRALPQGSWTKARGARCTVLASSHSRAEACASFSSPYVVECCFSAIARSTRDRHGWDDSAHNFRNASLLLTRQCPTCACCSAAPLRRNSSLQRRKAAEIPAAADRVFGRQLWKLLTALPHTFLIDAGNAARRPHCIPPRKIMPARHARVAGPAGFRTVEAEWIHGSAAGHVPGLRQSRAHIQRSTPRALALRSATSRLLMSQAPRSSPFATPRLCSDSAINYAGTAAARNRSKFRPTARRRAKVMSEGNSRAFSGDPSRHGAENALVPAR